MSTKIMISYRAIIGFNVYDKILKTTIERSPKITPHY